MDNLEEVGNWQRQKILGSGSFGIVELWKNDDNGNVIAIKNIKGGVSQLTEKQRERWILEVKTMKSLNHPNIVGTRKVPNQLRELEKEVPLLCMEYCGRGDLRTVLNQNENCCGIEEKEALKIMSHISSAVVYLHSQSLVHRDLKPENIVLQGPLKQTIYKLTDLGYVRELGDESVDGSVVGTCNYLAPELLWKRTYTNSCDYWSLGILFYEILTGNRPFLPNMPITQTWVRHMKAKRYEDITARGSSNNVVFSDQIENPSTISDCMRESLTQWFRVALQWDPSRRGKAPPRPEQPDQLVIFHFLRCILQLKVVYVFVVPLYKIETFAVNENISVKSMQYLIHERTAIEIVEQTLTDQFGYPIDSTDHPLFRCIEEQYLVVFDKNKLRVENLPKPKISPPLRQIIEHPRDSLDYETLRRCYAAAVFFIKEELELFKSYVMALSIKIDLSNSSLLSLQESVRTLKINANSLMNRLNRETQSHEFSLMSSELRENFDATIKGTRGLLEGAKCVSATLDVLSDDFDKLKSFSDGNWLKNWTQLYEKATSLYESNLRRNPGQHDSPVKMAKQIVYPALELHGKQLESPEIEAFISDITNFDTSITKLKTSLSSFEALVDVYKRNLDDILTRRASESPTTVNDLISTMSENDLKILENIVLTQVLDSALDAFEIPLEDPIDMDI